MKEVNIMIHHYISMLEWSNWGESDMFKLSCTNTSVIIQKKDIQGNLIQMHERFNKNVIVRTAILGIRVEIQYKEDTRDS